MIRLNSLILIALLFIPYNLLAQCILSWEEIEDATSYTVYYGPTRESSLPQSTVTIPTETCANMGLDPEPGFVLCVEASNLAGSSDKICITWKREYEIITP